MKVERVLIKVSGEAFVGESSVLDYDNILRICTDIKNLMELGICVSLVTGGGNIVRGRSFVGLDREDVDSMGMLSTVVNGIALRSCFAKIGVSSVLMSNLKLPFDIESSDFHNIQKQATPENVLIFVGGAGHPYFSTDTISVINAIATRSDVILKATKTDGIYDKDPINYKDAVHIPTLTHKEAIERNVQIMDQTAFLIAMEHRVPIMIFSINEPNCFVKLITGSINYSLVKS